MDTISPIPHRVIATKRVDIVDSDLATCEALSVLFRLEGFQTRFFVDATQFASRLSALSPDVVVLDMTPGNESGVDILRLIRFTLPGTPVIMIARAPDIDDVVLAMKYGATDVISTPIDAERLVSVVRNALRRDVHVGALRDGQRQVEVRGFSQLTKREREVLQLIVNGHSSKTAAMKLELSSRTIEVHRAKVMRKLYAKNTADLIRIVMTSR